MTKTLPKIKIMTTAIDVREGVTGPVQGYELDVHPFDWQVPEVVEFIGANFTNEQRTEIVRQLVQLESMP